MTRQGDLRGLQRVGVLSVQPCDVHLTFVVPSQVIQGQLPPPTAAGVNNGLHNGESERQRGPFDDFPSLHHKVRNGGQRRFHVVSAMPASQSDHMLDAVSDGDKSLDGHSITNELRFQTSPDHQGDAQSSITVNAAASGSSMSETRNATMEAVHLDGAMQSSASGMDKSRLHGNNRRCETQSEPSSPAKTASGQARSAEYAMSAGVEMTPLRGTL